ncbi:LamG-like jellyroll fold domain-containing protein [Fibrobacter sp.]|uniref:LamG-like jellyroll fold domain-containing protein n=1 Tax=Fibrobacter sp. TaxID=35828 RepID=UPI00388E2C49
MNKKIVKFLAVVAVLSGSLFFGCSTSDSGTDSFSSEDALVYQKNDAARMWSRIDVLGIAGYFDSLSQMENAPVINVASLVNRHCPIPALAMDENTRFLDELESLFDEGEQVKGVCGNALKLNDGQVAPLGVNLIDSMKIGTVEFWFRPNEDFYDRNARTLMGNDGARIHFFYKDGELYFQKNHHNQHFFVKGKANLKNDWNLIAGQWGDGYMSVWLNGEMVACWEHDKGYAPATRGVPFENLVVIGYKSGCCMEGAGQYTGMTTSGAFDQFRISNIPRYKMPDNVVTEPDSSVSDASVVDTIPVDTLVNDSVPVDTATNDMLVADTTEVARPRRTLCKSPCGRC